MLPTDRQLADSIRVLRLAAESPGRRVCVSECTLTHDDVRTWAALVRSGYVYKYPGAYGIDMARATDEGRRYLSQVSPGGGRS